MKGQENIKVIDNYLDKEAFKKIQSFLLSDNFPWFYNESQLIYTKKFHKTYSPIKGYETQDQHLFTHNFLGYNEIATSWTAASAHLAPLLNKIGPKG